VLLVGLRCSINLLILRGISFLAAACVLLRWMGWQKNIRTYVLTERAPATAMEVGDAPIGCCLTRKRHESIATL